MFPYRSIYIFSVQNVHTPLAHSKLIWATTCGRVWCVSDRNYKCCL